MKTQPPQHKGCNRSCRQNDQRWPHQTAILRTRYHALRQDCRSQAVSAAWSLLHRIGRGRCCWILRGTLMRLQRRSPFDLAHQIGSPRQACCGKPSFRRQRGEISGRHHGGIPATQGTQNLHCALLTCGSPLPSDLARSSAPMLGRIIALLPNAACLGSETRNCILSSLAVKQPKRRVAPFTALQLRRPISEFGGLYRREQGPSDP